MASIYTEEYKLVIHALKTARIKQNITQKELAQALNRPQSFIAKVENGERRLDIVEFVHIARLLSLEPNIILEILNKYILNHMQQKFLYNCQ